MEFNTIYKNGKPQYFFIKTENAKEFDFIQPYFIVTNRDQIAHAICPVFARGAIGKHGTS